MAIIRTLAVFKPNREQLRIIKYVIDWYYSFDDREPIFVIKGYAGTGKSSIVNIIIQSLGLLNYNVLFTAFTGKASNVLRMKGNPANTIHKTFYHIIKKGQTLTFRLKKNLPYFIHLIVIDEFSMIDDKMVRDILSFQIPVIALGDPGQLPPIFGTNKYIHDEKWPVLKKIMRQTDHSGILDLADKARHGETIPYGSYKKTQVLSFNDDYNMIDYDVVLCWKNETRNRINYMIRDELQFYDQFPMIGEKVICLNNNYNYMIEKNNIPFFLVNGLVCYVQSYSRIRDDVSFLVKIKPDCFDESDPNYYVTAYSRPFITGSDPHPDDYNEQFIHLDFGYALTCHKSQGSEWDNVLIINEYRGSRSGFNQWLYTAITRAKKTVTIIT